MRLITRIMTMLLMFVCTAATAQTTIVKGVLQDSVTHEGEPYATVRVYKGTSTKGSADAMSVTDADGNILQKRHGPRPLYHRHQQCGPQDHCPTADA